jgi:hypothetical protein
MSVHVHYLVGAYSAKNPADGNLFDYVAIDVFATSETEAKAKAKRYVRRAQYDVTKVIEHDPELDPQH